MSIVLETPVKGIILPKEGVISSQILATGNGLHVELDEHGVISLVLWGLEIEDDVTIFEAKLTPEQEHRIRNADKVDAWKIDPVVYQQCVAVQ
jgi:hypothetical protein